MPKAIHPDDVRPEFRKVVRDLRRHLGPTLAEMKLTPVLDWDDEESMQSSSHRRRRKTSQV